MTEVRTTDNDHQADMDYDDRAAGRLSKVRRIYAQKGLIRGTGILVAYLRWKSGGSKYYGDTEHTDHDWFEMRSRFRPEPFSCSPLISIIVPVYNTPAKFLRTCIDSVRRQNWRKWELVLVNDASTSGETTETLQWARSADSRIRVIDLGQNRGISGATNAGIEVCEGDWIAFMDHDDELVPTALEWFASVSDKAELIYSDEAKRGPDGRVHSLHFKPAWSPRLLLSHNYITHLTAIRADLLGKVGNLREGFDGAQDHDLLLRIAELNPTVAHLPHILYLWREWEGSTAAAPTSKAYAEDAGRRSIQEAITRRGWHAKAVMGRGLPMRHTVGWLPQAEAGLVKIVIPTRDRLRLLKVAVNGVLNRTEHVPIHLVIVDNGSVKTTTLKYLDEIQQDSRVSVLRVDDAFNFSRICNLGTRVGPDASSYLFLNNDIEILHRDWLLQMAGWLSDPEVAAVGTELFYPDRTIQHAGVFMGCGGIAHHYAAHLANQPYLGIHHDSHRESGGVTAACMLVRAADFEAIGGFFEGLPVDFQDVDLCLQLTRNLGKVIVYDPTFPLIHHESASRGNLEASNGYTVSRMLFRWGPLPDFVDPYFHPFGTSPIPTYPNWELGLSGPATLNAPRIISPRVPGHS